MLHRDRFLFGETESLGKDLLMLGLTILASGSSGNCSVVDTPRSRLLVDAGISSRQIVKRLAIAGLSPLELDGIVLTHEHGDHVCGLPVFLKNFPLPVYCNRATCELLKREGLDFHRDWRVLETGQSFSIKDLEVETFSVPHDAVDPVGLVFHYKGQAIGFLTDLGYPTKLVFERIRKVTTLLIETNHDEQLLAGDGKRPWSVKQRILSRHGHLSNTAAAAVLRELAGGRLKCAILGHLSRDCNTPERALAAARQALEDRPFQLVCASPTDVLQRIEA